MLIINNNMGTNEKLNQTSQSHSLICNEFRTEPKNGGPSKHYATVKR